MDILLFITDRYPFGKGEAFIENEVQHLSGRFDKVIIVPTALTVGDDISRTVPDNFIVLPPANTDDLYKDGRPSSTERIVWSMKHMIPWCMLSLFDINVLREIKELVQTHAFSFSRVASVVRAMAPIKRNIRHFRKYRDRLLMRKDDNIFIYSYWLNYNIAFIQKTFDCQQSQIKSIISRAHGYDLYSERRNNVYIAFQKRIIAYVDKVCLISKNGLDYLTQRIPEYSSKYFLNYLGTKDYGEGIYKPEEIFHIVSCSSVIPVKRVTRIVDALVKIKKHKIKWTHFGAGQDFAKLENYVSTLNINKNISIELKGQIFNQELMAYYKHNSVDLFINVSESEGLPVSIMEAISFGIPVIATDVGGTADAIIQNENGWLLPSNYNDDELAARIEELINLNQEHYMAMRVRSREIWEERFFENKNYSLFINEYF